MTRHTGLATGLATVALAAGGIGIGIGIASAQPRPEPNPSGDAGQPAERMPMQGDMRELHRQMVDQHREMMRDPEMRGHMRSPEMRMMHRDMMRMMGPQGEMPETDMMG